MDLHERHERIMAELRMHGSISVADFAERTGVSAMTVRRDLRELADAGRVRRIHGGAEAVDLPDLGPGRHRPPSRGGSGGQEQAGPLFTLGQVTPDPSYNFPEIVDGAAERTRSLGGRLVLGVSRYQKEREQAQIGRLIAGGVDALLVTTTVADSFEVLAALAGVSVPVVMVERAVDEAPAGDELESVRTDHAAGAVIAVRHLAELGHEHIGMVSYETPTSPFLRAGFERSVQQLGLRTDGEPVMVEEDDEREESTRRHLADAVDRGVTALLVHSDHYAVEVAGMAGEMGIDVPGDLSLITYDDQVADLAPVPLTAVSPPRRDIGRLAATMAFERLATAGTVSSPRHVTLRPHLVVRDSAAAPR